MPRILLVEDNEINRDMLSRRLERRGYSVLCASDGQQGIDVAIREKPDLILMDMSLPVVDGWEATRRLKADPAVRGIPVIALTAHAMASDEQQAREAGCDDFDTKPVELPLGLLQKIDLPGPQALDPKSARLVTVPLTHRPEPLAAQRSPAPPLPAPGVDPPAECRGAGGGAAGLRSLDSHNLETTAAWFISVLAVTAWPIRRVPAEQPRARPPDCGSLNAARGVPRVSP